MAAALAEMPGVTFNFTQPMAMRLDEVVSGVKADVAVKIFGQDPATLERLGEEIRAVLDEVRGAADLQVEVLSGRRAGADRRRPAPDRPLRPERRRRARARRDGHRRRRRHRGPRRPAAVRRRGPLPGRACAATPSALGQLLLTAPGGEKVPLARVAASSARSRRPRPSTTRTASAGSSSRRNVRGRDVGSFVAEAQQRMASAVTLPAGYYVEWGGQFENQAAGHARGSWS